MEYGSIKDFVHFKSYLIVAKKINWHDLKTSKKSPKLSVKLYHERTQAVTWINIYVALILLTGK